MATPVCKRTDSQDMGEKSTLFKLDGVEEGRREREGGGRGGREEGRGAERDGYAMHQR